MQYGYIFPNNGYTFPNIAQLKPLPLLFMALTDLEMMVLPSLSTKCFSFFLHCSFLFFFCICYALLDNWLPCTRETSQRPNWALIQILSDNAFFFCIAFFFAFVKHFSTHSQVHVHKGALTLVLSQWFQNELCTGTFTCRVLHSHTMKSTFLWEWGSVTLNCH